MGIRLVANPFSFDYYLGLMKNLLRYLAFVLIVGSVYAQSNLPACPSSGHFDNCFGTRIRAYFPDKYVGEFKDDKFHGQGTFTYVNGDEYVGEFKDGKFDGQGTFTFANGSKYVGEWKDRRWNGQGTLFNSNGSVINMGVWRNNHFVSSAPVQQAIAPSVQQSNTPNPEIARLRAEEAKRKQTEEELRLAQQQDSQTTVTQPSQSAISSGKRVALVVGNKNYKVRPLQNSLNDANDMSRSLRTSGFEVIDLRDATLSQMRTAVRQFGDKLLTYDVGLVYYSGHGLEVWHSPNFVDTLHNAI